MQTNFAPELLENPDMRESETILRTCVHCGFCTATCPTYLLLGDELDSPRGRIYLMKDMLENGKPASEQVVTHIDRCLSCLSCMTTCPSGVHYMHLVDHARAHIEETYQRPWHDRLMRSLLSAILPYPGRFRLALFGAYLGKPFKGVAKALPKVGPRMGAMLDLAPGRLPTALGPGRTGRIHRARRRTRARVDSSRGLAPRSVAGRSRHQTKAVRSTPLNASMAMHPCESNGWPGEGEETYAGA